MLGPEICAEKESKNMKGPKMAERKGTNPSTCIAVLRVEPWRKQDFLNI